VGKYYTMSDLISYQHVCIIYMIVMMTKDIKTNWRNELEKWEFPEDKKKRMIMTMDFLSCTDRNAWATKDMETIIDVTTYILYNARHGIIDLNKTFDLLDKNLTEEWKTGIMDKAHYLKCREMNFTCRKVIMKLDRDVTMIFREREQIEIEYNS